MNNFGLSYWMKGIKENTCHHSVTGSKGNATYFSDIYRTWMSGIRKQIRVQETAVWVEENTQAVLLGMSILVHSNKYLDIVDDGEIKLIHKNTPYSWERELCIRKHIKLNQRIDPSRLRLLMLSLQLAWSLSEWPLISWWLLEEDWNKKF